MTKTEYKFLRRQYRQRCKKLLAVYQNRAKDEFYTNDEALALYEEYWACLVKFAELVGCSIPRAGDILNLR